MTNHQNPPTLEEIRAALRAFAGEARSAQDIFEGRLEYDPRGKSWGWDGLRKKVREALGAMECGAWTQNFEIVVPANVTASLIDDPEAWGVIISDETPEEVLEAVRLHESLRQAIFASTALLAGADQLPVPDGPRHAGTWIKRVKAHRAKLDALRERMEDLRGPEPRLVIAQA